MNPKHFKTAGLILAVALVGVAYYALYQHDRGQSVLHSKPAPTPAPTPAKASAIAPAPAATKPTKH